MHHSATLILCNWPIYSNHFKVKNRNACSTNQNKKYLPIAANKRLVNSHTGHKILAFPQPKPQTFKTHIATKAHEGKEDRVVLQVKD